jgi:uncharacterized membrane protein YdjX (TVP38/TMEM64 family)
VAALLGVRTRTFLLATLIGKVPVNFIYAGLGEQIGQASSVQDLFTLRSLLALTALGLLALTPVAIRHLKPRLLPSEAV